MKRIIAVLLFISFSGSVFHLDEMTKVPALFAHFMDHRSDNPSLSLLSFLYNHYIKDKTDGTAADSETDKQLPFKSARHVHLSFVSMTENRNSFDFSSVQFSRIHYPCMQLRVSKPCFKIWQPPKVM